MQRPCMHRIRRVARNPHRYAVVLTNSHCTHARLPVTSVPVQNEHSWADYVRALHANQSEVSRRAGIAASTVSRWISGSTPEAAQVIAVARAFGESPIYALVVAGYLSASESGAGVTTPRGLQLRGFTELELAQELVRRIEAGETEYDEEPISNVTQLGDVSGRTQDADELTDLEQLPFAAKSAATEVEEDDHTP